MAITSIKRNLVSLGANGEPWLVQAYSADATTAEMLLNAVAGTDHFIRKLKVQYTPGTTAKYWVLVDANESEITARVDAINPGGETWSHTYSTPLPCEVGHPIRIIAEAAGAISVTMEGFSRQARLRADSYPTPASSSVSASVSASTSVSSTPSVSTSISSSPSASLSTSASPSVSQTPSTSVSASVSTSISASPSVSSSTS